MPLVICLIGAVILYDWLHKKWVGSVWIMGSCRTFLWCVAASAGGLEISNPVWVGSLFVGAYVVGISLFARNESKKTENNSTSKLAILLLFAPCLLTLGLLILWNHLDPTRVFLLNCVGLYLGWIVIRAILIMRNSALQGAIGKGVSILLARNLCSGCNRRLFLYSIIDCSLLSRTIFCPNSTKEVCGNLRLNIRWEIMPSRFATINRNIRLDFNHRVYFHPGFFLGY